MEPDQAGGGLARILNRLQSEGTATKMPEADLLLQRDPNAVLLAVLLEQRIRAEVAFRGPYFLAQRLSKIDLKEIAEMDADRFREIFRQEPPIHRFPNMMSKRMQELARAVVEKYGGRAENIWHDVEDFETFRKRIKDLPGFGDTKVKKLAFSLHFFGHKDMAHIQGMEKILT